ncbi:MAG: hypothetical protein WC866_04765 [Patescibacteria group bacterium]|jgi:hypothetical protein
MESTSLVLLPRLELIGAETLPSKDRRELAMRTEQQRFVEKQLASAIGLTFLSGVFTMIYGTILFFSWGHALFSPIFSGIMLLAALSATYIMSNVSVRLQRSLRVERVPAKLVERAAAENALCSLAIDVDHYASNWNNAAAHVEALSEPDPALLERLRKHRKVLEAKQRELRQLAKRLERINKTS